MDGEEGGGPGDASASSSQDQQVDNSETVIAKIANLYAERLMSDVVLVVGPVEYPSHRLILCASSDVFQVMLMNPNWSESRETRVVLRETPSGEAVFEDFLKYLYTGKILLDYATVIPLVSLADKYNVRDLLRIGLDFMARNVASACKKNQVVSWLQFAAASGHALVTGLCRDFIAANFQKISTNIDFPNLEPEALAEFLRRSDLVVHDENALFSCLDSWLRARRDMMVKAGEEHVDVHMDRLVQGLLPLIRFPMMTPYQLVHLTLSSIAETHQASLVDRIRAAMIYHQKFRDDPEAAASAVGDRRLLTPRLYTCDRFCASLSVDHFRGLQSYHRRSLVFATHRHTADCMMGGAAGADRDTPPPGSGGGQGAPPSSAVSEWAVEVYPKGVWFQKCLTCLPPVEEVPERVLRTVRVSVCGVRGDEEEEGWERRVRVGVLFMAEEGGFEHVGKVVSRNYFFSEGDRVVNFDDVVDFDELRDLKRRSRFLCGAEGDSIKVAVVVAPLTRLSCLETV